MVLRALKLIGDVCNKDELDIDSQTNAHNTHANI